jgi:chromosome segregation ATPase
LQPRHHHHLKLAEIAMSELEYLQAARAELQRRRKHLRTTQKKYDELLESSSPESGEVSKAKAGVAEAKLGVAEAELDEAKAKLCVAEAKEDTPATQHEIAKAEMGVAKAEWDVAKAAYDVAEAKGSNQQRLESLQGEIVAKQATYQRLEGQLSRPYFRATLAKFCMDPYVLGLLPSIQGRHLRNVETNLSALIKY